MNKIICLFRDRNSLDYAGFHEMVKELSKNIINKLDPRRISYTITLEKPPKVSVIPLRRSMISVVSVYVDKNPDLDFLKDSKGLSGCFSVTEALPVSYNKDWKDGSQSPGICLLTLFRKKEGIDYDTFIDRWHKGHTPLSLKIHPLWHYNRNVVNDAVIEGPDWYDGIVEEHCKKDGDLLNPIHFFGGVMKMVPNMIRVYRDVNSFIQYSSIESYLMREYHVPVK